MPYIQRALEEQINRALGNQKVLFILGARQVGKTTLLKHLLKASEGSLLNMDIDVDRARLIAAAKLTPAQAVRSLSSGRLLVIDEAHRVPDIGRITKGWYDAGVDRKIVLLGSSSVTLLDIAAAELTGRNEKLYLTPLLLSEVLAQQSWSSDAFTARDLHTNFSDQIRSLILERLVFGSYPDAYLAEHPEQYLTNLTSDYLFKDIFTASLVRSPEDVRRLLLELASNLGQTLAITQLATRLKISRQTVQRYLDLLESIFVIFRLPAYHTNPAREITKSHKYYFWDTGVKNALQREWTASENRSDIHALWENFVLAEVVKQSHTERRLEDLFFWQSRNSSSVELLIKQGSTLHPFNIRFHPHAAPPSQSFANTYGVAPKIIHPGNILEVVG